MFILIQYSSPPKSNDSTVNRNVNAKSPYVGNSNGDTAMYIDEARVDSLIKQEIMSFNNVRVKARLDDSFDASVQRERRGGGVEDMGLAFQMKPPTPHRSTPTRAKSQSQSGNQTRTQNVCSGVVNSRLPGAFPRPQPQQPRSKASTGTCTKASSIDQIQRSKTKSRRVQEDTADAKRTKAAQVRASRLDYGKQVRAMNQRKGGQ